MIGKWFRNFVQQPSSEEQQSEHHSARDCRTMSLQMPAATAASQTVTGAAVPPTVTAAIAARRAATAAIAAIAAVAAAAAATATAAAMPTATMIPNSRARSRRNRNQSLQRGLLGSWGAEFPPTEFHSELVGSRHGLRVK